MRPAPPEHYSWIADRASLVVDDQFRAIEAMDGARIAGMVAFTGWTPNAVHLHIALESPIALRRLVTHGFGIAFNRCGKGVALAPVMSTNRRSIRLVEHLGFRLAGVLADAWAPGVDVRIYQMRRDECRWLKEAKWAA